MDGLNENVESLLKLKEENEKYKKMKQPKELLKSINDGLEQTTNRD